MSVSDSQKAANERCHKANVTKKTIGVHPAETDILAQAMEQPNFAGYVKGLVFTYEKGGLLGRRLLD